MNERTRTETSSPDVVDGLVRASGILAAFSAFVGFGIGWIMCKALS
ncbi:hypothetical protein [Afipia sp. DC4300-2b1]